MVLKPHIHIHTEAMSPTHSSSQLLNYRVGRTYGLFSTLTKTKRQFPPFIGAYILIRKDFEVFPASAEIILT
jgi:hypothetical protein